MAYVTWDWSNAEYRRGFEELEIVFTIHNDPAEMPERSGLFLMLSHHQVSGKVYYFGLQTDGQNSETPYENMGPAFFFSCWCGRDLEDTRHDEEYGWTQSSGHEGDFIGVRRLYDWGAGSYHVRMGPDGRDQTGNWLSVWITDLATDETTWIGSIRFPRIRGEARIAGHVYSTLEVYGSWVRPIDISELHVSIERPVGDGQAARKAQTGYDMFRKGVGNTNIWFEENEVHLKVGGTTERTAEPEQAIFR